MKPLLYKNPITKIIACEKLHIYPSKMLHCKGRMTNGLIIFLEGTSKYFYNNTSLTSEVNSLLFLPKGLDYYIIRDVYAECIYINFETAFEVNDLPFSSIYPNSSTIKELFLSALRICNTKKAGYEASIMSVLYKIISIVQLNNSFQYVSGANYSKIAPSVEYIKQNYFAGEISTPMLAKMCNMSPRYYHKLFNLFFMCTPKQYVIGLKIDMAKKLLISTEYDLSEIAETCGFCDVYHFCKTFKKVTEFTPSEFRYKSDRI